MSDSEKEALAVYRVVDKRGVQHSVTADRMLVDGGSVLFFSKERGQIGSFSDPIGVVLDEASQSGDSAGLIPGEACVSVFGSAELGAVQPHWVMVAGVAGLIGLFGLKVYELFWFGGVS